MPIEVPEAVVLALQDHAARLFDSRKDGTDLRSLARDLLCGLFDACTYAGCDDVQFALAANFPPADGTDRTGLADHDVARAALVARLEALDLESRGPRAARPRQLTDAVVGALELTVVPTPQPSTLLGDDVRLAVIAAMTSVLDEALAPPVLRAAIIADAHARADASVHGAFAKMTAHLDDRGLQLIKQAKVPIDAMQAVQRALAEARAAVIGRATTAAIDRAKALIASADADAAARIDRPVTLHLTPREIAILRACDARLFKTPPNVVQAVLAGMIEPARIAWRAAEKTVHPYTTKRTYAIGDLIDHPKFGRGTVISRMAERVDVEFADGKRTLVHIAARS